MQAKSCASIFVANSLQDIQSNTFDKSVSNALKDLPISLQTFNFANISNHVMLDAKPFSKSALINGKMLSKNTIFG